jgi:alpha-L-fucosidase
MLQEDIASGQRVEAFEVEVFSDGDWRPAANGTVIGYKRLLRFPDATVSKLRIRFTQFRVRPTLAGLGLYLAPAIVSAPKISRDRNGLVTITPAEGTCARYTLDDSEPTEISPLYTKPVAMPDGGPIIARAFPLTPGKDLPGSATPTRSMDFGLAKAKWKIVDCDSQDGDEGAPGKAIDDDPTTFWHTRYRDGTDPMPHHLSVDLGETVSVSGFAYTPRQDRWDDGIFAVARFELSEDGKNWTVVADNTAFDNIANSRQQQVVKLKTPTKGHYFRVTALRTVNNNNIASAADVSVLVK